MNETQQRKQATGIDPRVKSVAIFACVFVAATSLHWHLRPYIEPTLNRDINAANAARLINLLTPTAGVQAVGNTIGAGTSYVAIASSRQARSSLPGGRSSCRLDPALALPSTPDAIASAFPTVRDAG